MVATPAAPPDAGTTVWIHVDGDAIPAVRMDNAASRSLLSQLPLSVTLARLRRAGEGRGPPTPAEHRGDAAR